MTTPGTSKIFEKVFTEWKVEVMVKGFEPDMWDWCVKNFRRFGYLSAMAMKKPLAIAWAKNGDKPPEKPRKKYSDEEFAFPETVKKVERFSALNGPGKKAYIPPGLRRQRLLNKYGTKQRN